MQETWELSTLPKTWIFDLDGTLVKNNGYKLDGEDTLLPGVADYLRSLPAQDRVLILTAREACYEEMTRDFLDRHGVRYDEILFGMPQGERIVVNDCKPSGLLMAHAVNLVRNRFEMPEIVEDK